MQKKVTEIIDLMKQSLGEDGTIAYNIYRSVFKRN